MNQQQHKTRQNKQSRSKAQQAVVSPSVARKPAHPLLQVQGVVGNHGLLLHHDGSVIQSKLRIGAPNDRYEQEADRVADKIVNMPEPAVQRQCQECASSKAEDEKERIQTKPVGDEITPLIQRQASDEDLEEPTSPKATADEEEELAQTKPFEATSNTAIQRQSEEEDEASEDETIRTKRLDGKAPTVGNGLPAQLRSARGHGQPLPATVRNFYEPRFGRDFSGVRIHTGNHAAQMNQALNARAFTTGKDIFFNEGEYQPGTSRGKRLLGHELVHVVQQHNRIRLKPDRKRRRLFSEVESSKEKKWSQKSSGFMWRPEKLHRNEAIKRWLKTRTKRGMRADIAYGWLLWNFQFGKANLNKRKKFKVYISLISSHIKKFLNQKSGKHLLYNTAYIGIFGRHSKSGKDEINSVVASERANNVWRYFQGALPPSQTIIFLDPEMFFKAPLPLSFSPSVFKLPIWIRDQKPAFMRALNRSVEVIAFFKEAQARKDWRKEAKKKLEKAPPEVGVFGTWILNNWEFFMNPKRSGYAWIKSHPIGDKYGLFFQPPEASEFVSSEIREIQPDKSIVYFNRLFKNVETDLNNLAGFFTARPLNQCNQHTCRPIKSPFERNLKLKVTCKVRFCRYHQLLRDANKGSAKPKFIWQMKWRDGNFPVCKWCFHPASFPGVVRCGDQTPSCKILWP